MEDNHKLGLYISYYLSRFNKQAYQNLGFGTQSKTHAKIGELMGINPHTIKNWRDEFDPIHGHRAGWYQRSMIPSRLNLVEALQDLEESDIRDIVLDILYNKFNHFEEQKEILAAISSNERKKDTFVPRGPTGKKAEEFFINHFAEHGLPFNGKLNDTRDNGCGYDFELITEKIKYYIEVKGIAANDGGIMFTNKEWATAKKEGEKYYLVIISDIDKKPKIKIINNPANSFDPKKNILTVIQVNWTLSGKEIKKQFEN